MKEGQKVKITKLMASPEALYPTPKSSEYTPGVENGGIQDSIVSLPAEYTIEGILQSDITIGKSVSVFRNKRNGIEVPGWFHSSPVITIDSNKFTTQNSVYLIENI